MDLTPDPLLERLDETVRARLAPITARPDSSGVNELAVLDDIDAQAMEAPANAGGFDLGVSCGVVITVELGRQALRDPYSGTALVIDALAASSAPSDAVVAFIKGERRAVAAEFDPSRRPTGRRTINGTELSGRVALADSGLVVADCCVPVSVDGAVSLVLIPADQLPGQPVPSRSSPAVLDLTGVSIPDELIIGTFGRGDPLSDPDGLLTRARLRQAGYLLGLGQGAHQLAVRHATTRRQFDQYLVEFQAIAFPLARTVIALRAVHLAVRRGAWLADNGGPAGQAAIDALALATDTAIESVRLSMQVHGARGMSGAASTMPSYHKALRVAVARFGPATRLWREAGLRRVHDRISPSLLAADSPVGGGD